MQKLNIIGAGRVGKTLAKRWHTEQVFSIGAVVNRSLNSATESCHFIGQGTAYPTIADMPPSDVIMIACSDDKIATIAKELALHHDVKHKVCFHVSGCIASSELQALKEQGAYIASLHPLKSFAEPSIACANFDGTFCALEGDIMATNLLQAILSQIGAKCIPMHVEDKALYHTALSMGCNHLIGLMHIVQGLLSKTHIPSELSQQMIKHMITTMLENVWQLGTKDALTGPIVRGDVKPVSMHLKQLEEFPEHWARVYRALGKELTIIAKEQQTDNPEIVQLLEMMP